MYSQPLIEPDLAHEWVRHPVYKALGFLCVVCLFTGGHDFSHVSTAILKQINNVLELYQHCL